ncbi:MAG: hypothetical protein JWP15_473 [Alphaproteobacteria bacterium]|nr:hypothetical protein [Alphaproteobacteria bacterium]
MADKQLVGVGGWLALFAFGTGVIAPLRVARDLTGLMEGDNQAAAAQFGALWTFLLAAEWVISLLTIATCWFMVWRLYNLERWSTVRIVIAGIWSIGLGRSLIEIWLWSLVLDTSVIVEELGPIVGLGVAYGLIWTAYFLRSRRVANTYRRDVGDEQVGDTFA